MDLTKKHSSRRKKFSVCVTLNWWSISKKQQNNQPTCLRLFWYPLTKNKTYYCNISAFNIRACPARPIHFVSDVKGNWNSSHSNQYPQSTYPTWPIVFRLVYSVSFVSHPVTPAWSTPLTGTKLILCIEQTRHMQYEHFTGKTKTKHYIHYIPLYHRHIWPFVLEAFEKYCQITLS